jgi:rhomboid protease GluP
LGFVIPGIDNAAHLGGLVTGVSLGMLAMRQVRAVPLAALVVSCIVLTATLALPDRLVEAYRESRDFAVRYTRFAQDDHAINRSLLELVEDSRAGRISDAAGLLRLEQDLIPRLAAISASLAERPYVDPQVDANRARWARYAALRLEAVEAIRDAIAGRRDDGVRVFEKKMSEAAAIVRDAAPR